MDYKHKTAKQQSHTQRGVPLYLKFTPSHSIPLCVKKVIFNNICYCLLSSKPLKLKVKKCNSRPKTHLVLVEGIRDVIGHVTGWMG